MSIAAMKKLKKMIGILAFQGDVIEHAKIIEKLGHRAIEIRSVEDLKKIDALIIPGGESTTIGFFLETTGLGEALKKMATSLSRPLPIWGTCAGSIILAKKIESHIIPYHLSLMDITVMRNAYGRQIDSFYTSLEIPALSIRDLKAAFIRAPIITEAHISMPGHKLFQEPEFANRPCILATHEGKIVLVQQGKLLASTFHPELTEDTRLHEYFISLIP